MSWTARSAMRAQLLYEALTETPVASIEQRLAKAGELERSELDLALQEQLIVQQRMQEQLEHFDEELERMVVELDTVRGNVLQHGGLRRYRAPRATGRARPLPARRDDRGLGGHARPDTGTDYPVGNSFRAS